LRKHDGISPSEHDVIQYSDIPQGKNAFFYVLTVRIGTLRGPR